MQPNKLQTERAAQFTIDTEGGVTEVLSVLAHYKSAVMRASEGSAF